jgi:hypothetical protein
MRTCFSSRFSLRRSASCDSRFLLCLFCSKSCFSAHCYGVKRIKKKFKKRINLFFKKRICCAPSAPSSAFLRPVME